jgi:basic amino acid/polyamine antiporter, APA family
MEQKKKLNTFDIFSLGFGGAVGSGIFVMMGLGIGHTGKSIVIALLGGCVIMLLAYMYNVVFSSMFVLSGGDYSQ